MQDKEKLEKQRNDRELNVGELEKRRARFRKEYRSFFGKDHAPGEMTRREGIREIRPTVPSRRRRDSRNERGFRRSRRRERGQGAHPTNERTRSRRFPDVDWVRLADPRHAHGLGQRREGRERNHRIDSRRELSGRRPNARSRSRHRPPRRSHRQRTDDITRSRNHERNFSSGRSHGSTRIKGSAYSIHKTG